MPRPAKYKPLLFTTTVRNLKIKSLLNIFQNYNGRTLTNDLATKIMGEIIRFGLYRPTRGIEAIEQNGDLEEFLTIHQLEKVLNNEEVTFNFQNPQKHKEAEFDEGWPSRFATIFDFAKELGLYILGSLKKSSFQKLD